MNWRTWWPAAALALFGLLLGLYPHIKFSLDYGGFFFFKNAFDEDTYALYPLALGEFRIDRLLGGASFEFLRLLLGSPQAALIALDAIYPPLVMIAAYSVAREVCATMPARILLALLLAFAPDLFTLGNSAVHPDGPLTLANFRALFGEGGAELVPPYETSYLTLLRTPEPQASLAAGFALIAMMLVLLRLERAPGPFVAGLTAVQVLVTISYALVSYPILMAEAGIALLLALQRRWRPAAILAGLFVASLVAIALNLTIREDAAGGLLFASRLPIITPSVILAGSAAMISATVLLVRRPPFSSMLWIALGFALIPLILTNQQMLTGMMVSARDWERNANAAFAVLSFALIAAHFAPFLIKPSLAPVGGVIAGVATLGVLYLVVAGAGRGYGYWLNTNLSSIAIARAVGAAEPLIDGEPRLLLEEPGLAPIVAVRRSGRREALLDYTEVFRDPVPPSGARLELTPLARGLFRYWRLRGVTPQEAETILNGEAIARGGYYSAFFFNMCEFWFPCTDNRAVRSELIAARIPEVVDLYRAYLDGPAPQVGGALLFVTTSAEPALEQLGLAADEPIATGSAGETTARVYLMN